jgi:hypothetical protein
MALERQFVCSLPDKTIVFWNHDTQQYDPISTGSDQPVPTGTIDGGTPGSQYGGLDTIDGGGI